MVGRLRVQIAEKKEKVSLKELDAIVASSAMQVPSTYKLDTYLITSGNTISATAHIKLIKDGEAIEGVYIGDGSIDAAFKAIENILNIRSDEVFFVYHFSKIIIIPDYFSAFTYNRHRERRIHNRIVSCSFNI